VPYAHALLALLAEQRSYAWQLRNGVDATLGDQWSGASRSHVYAILKRMEKDGLITASPDPSADHRPDITIHEITDAGRQELARWIAEPTERTAGYRDDFAVKVMAAALHGVGAVRQVCDAQRQARMAELQALHALRDGESDDTLQTWTAEVAIGYVEADLRAVKSAESRAERIVRDMPAALAPFLTRRGENTREAAQPGPSARAARSARSARSAS
jgi:DNA-binding PadR family transcriptional regulator